MTANELLAKTRVFADQLYADQGSIIGMIYLHTTVGSVIGVPYKTGNVSVAEQQQSILSVIRTMRSAGIFGGATLLSEAWVTKIKPGQEAVAFALRPSLDSDRIEMLVALVLAHDGTKALGEWEIDRTGAHPRVGAEIETQFDRLDTWLDDAFKTEVGHEQRN